MSSIDVLCEGVGEVDSQFRTVGIWSHAAEHATDASANTWGSDTVVPPPSPPRPSSGQGGAGQRGAGPALSPREEYILSLQVGQMEGFEWPFSSPIIYFTMRSFAQFQSAILVS